MALTYTYATRQVSHFSLKRVEGSCHRDENHTVLIGVFCKRCPFYAGLEDGYVVCEYHKEDDPGASEVRHYIYDRLENDALRALDY